ncbi:MAG: radical SAM-associated putative lipoprotein [Bacteroidales bacterium]|jgi:putative lipoprotein (rSAM/lipoprotein system)
MKHSRKRLGFFAMVLALLGLGGCEVLEEAEGLNEGRMYGPPVVKYSSKGKVTDVTGNPIPGIEVSITGRFKEQGQLVYTPLTGSAVYSDGDGNWKTENRHMVNLDAVTIHFKDIDGQNNGGYWAEDSTTVNVVFKKSNEAKIDVPDFQMHRIPK